MNPKPSRRSALKLLPIHERPPLERAVKTESEKPEPARTQALDAFGWSGALPYRRIIE